MKPKRAKNDPWTRLDAMFAATKEPVGPEWFTAAQARERYGWTEQQFHKRLSKLKRAGTIEKWRGPIAGKCGLTTKYRFAK